MHGSNSGVLLPEFEPSQLWEPFPQPRAAANSGPWLSQPELFDFPAVAEGLELPAEQSSELGEHRAGVCRR